MASGKIIFVVTNIGYEKSGWSLPEVAHPYYALDSAGYEIVYVSRNGGVAPMDEGSGEAFKSDKICQQFLEDKNGAPRLNNTIKVDSLNPGDFEAMFYVGGHSAMFDIPSADKIAELAAKIYEQGGILGAVGYGTVGFVPVKLSNGDALVKGKTVTSFTNKEEGEVKLVTMPFMLETILRRLNATFVGKENWAPNVQVSECERIVTGQNPASAEGVGETMVRLLEKNASVKK